MIFHRQTSILLAIAILCVSASGCAGSRYGRQTTKVNYYSGCYQPIADLRRDASNQTGGTVGGAIAGSLIGAAVGYAATGKAGGAAIGAVAGGMAGAAAGHLIASDIQKKSEAERFAAYQQAMNKDLQGMAFAVAAAGRAGDCYERAYLAAKDQYLAGKIGKSEFSERLAEIRSGTTEANNILKAYSAEVDKNQIVYQDVVKKEAQAAGRPVPKPRKKTAKTTGGDQLQAAANRAEEIKNKNQEVKAVSANLEQKAALYNESYKAIIGEG